MDIERYDSRHLRDLYAISLATGHLGEDASSFYSDPDLIGQIYSAPYATLAPELVLLATDIEGITGFALGSLDTVAWEERLEREWWPALRARYPDPGGPKASWSLDQRRARMIHHPERVPEAIAERYPAHLHLNLLPRGQGRGIGRRLLLAWLALAGAPAVHVAINRDNHRAQRFWSTAGFEALDPGPGAAGRTVWMGKRAGGDAVETGTPDR
jgi:GNAT superfamily N-acetyltransferase